jgi:hypothetical protein
MNKKRYVDTDKIEIIDKVIDMLPGLLNLDETKTKTINDIKNKRTYIINQVLAPKDCPTHEHTVEKININDKFYYKDKYRCIFNDKIELVGIWEWNFSKNDFDYYIFTEDRKRILQASTNNCFSL